VDQVIEWGLEDTPGHVVNFTGGGMPWERVEAYLAASPLYQLGGAMTPTLIHVGAEDERVPPAHARTLYRALNFYLKVPSELIIYPGEPHELGRYDHRKTKMEWDHAWFDRYLGAGGAD
jgi:dipeptidyl aminopeptidase/acylaminoacyl peptidase